MKNSSLTAFIINIYFLMKQVLIRHAAFFFSFFFALFSIFLFQLYFNAGNVYASKLTEEQSKIQILKRQIKTELNELKSIETKISAAKAFKKSKIKGLIAIYSSMSPRKAAAILPHINKHLAVYILSNMNPKTASSIISHMNTKSAVFFTDSIAGK